MTDKRNRVFLGQVYERSGKYGKFYSGRLGAGQLVVSESKEPGKWNVYLEEQQQRDADKPTIKQGGFEDRMADDGIPFMREDR